MTTPTIKPEILVAKAAEAREHAYAPYSHYKVGAAVQTEDGRIFTGANVENAVYPLTLCAERVAITKAISEDARRIVAVAVVTANGGTPCGACRQVMREFGEPEMPVFVGTSEGHYREWTLEQLLPASFSAEDLG
ncbi:MAG: cytidine deaminase [Anaerolineae bacterium]